MNGIVVVQEDGLALSKQDAEVSSGCLDICN